MKAGPALRQLSSHRAIHEAAQAEAKNLTDTMIQLFHAEEEKDCLQAAKDLLKHWEEKIIAHADTEDGDEGLFNDLIAQGHEPKWLHMMTRDHNLFREIIASIKESLENEGKVTEEIVYEFTSLVIINRHHHTLEEKYLFNQ